MTIQTASIQFIPLNKLVALPRNVRKKDRKADARDYAIKAHAKLRKNELAAKVAVMFDGAGYLPDTLITPQTAGRR